MQILVSGKQLDVGDVLQNHVDKRLQSSITNKFSNSMDAHVVFSKEGHESRTDLLAHAIILRLGLMPAISMRPSIRHQIGWKYGCIVTSRVCRTNTVTNDRHPKTMWRKLLSRLGNPRRKRLRRNFSPSVLRGMRRIFIAER